MPKFIWQVNNIYKYIEQFLSFGKDQLLPNDEIIELAEFSLLCEWENQLLVNSFNWKPKLSTGP